MEPTPAQPQPRTIILEDGTYVEIKAGNEPGFSHCCGDSEYMMEVDCSEMLMRCYERKRGRWKQTYGKHCKKTLGQECYLHTCHNVCEAISTLDGMSLQ